MVKIFKLINELKAKQLIWIAPVLVISLILPVTFYAINKLSSITQQIDGIVNSNNKKTALIQEMESIIRARTFILIQMNGTDDPFILDDLQQELYQYASDFLKTREEFLAQKLSNEELIAWNKAWSQINTRTNDFTRTISLFSMGQKEQAMQFFYVQQMPGLKIIFEQFKLIKQTQEQFNHSKLQQVFDLKIRTKNVLYLTSFTIVIVVLFIVITINRRIHKIEQEKSEDQQKLNESHQRTQDLIDHATDGILCINDKQEITLFNPEAEKLFGYRADEVINKELTMLIPEEYRSDHLTHVHEFRDQTETHYSTPQSRKQYQLKGKNKNGRIFPASVGISKHLSNGEWVFTAFIRDVTEQNNFENALKESAKVAENANRVKTEFLANMSHELRTPMHAILSFSSLGAKKTRLGQIEEKDCQKLSRYFNNISEGGTRLLSLLNDLLDLSKLEAGKMELFIEQYDLNKCVEQCLIEVDGLLKEKSLIVNYKAPDINTVVSMDPLQIHQVIINFFSNAIKFTDKSKQITIDIQINDNFTEIMDKNANECNRKMLVLSVKDEGIGIPEDELEHVFDHFIQSSKTKTGAGGTGLGLSICQKIIHAHQGFIWAENRKDEMTGSIFYFALPINN